MNTQVTEIKKTADVKRDIAAQVLDRVLAIQEAGELTLPKNYNAPNALKSAFIVLSDPKNNLLEKCDRSSIAEALLKMVVYGVSPVRRQCYFIPYGNKLDCSISYMGNIAIAKRYGNLKSIKGNAIFKGDKFEFQVDETTGRRKIIKHLQTLESFGTTELLGAYAVYELNNGLTDVEVMNIKQIQASWNQGGAKGNSPAHKNFPDQMAIKTVINRACKLLISSSDDSVLYDPLDEKAIDVTDANTQHEIANNANKESLDFPEAENAVYDEFEPVEAEFVGEVKTTVEPAEIYQPELTGPGF